MAKQPGKTKTILFLEPINKMLVRPSAEEKPTHKRRRHPIPSDVAEKIIKDVVNAYNADYDPNPRNWPRVYEEIHPYQRLDLNFSLPSKISPEKLNRQFDTIMKQVFDELLSIGVENLYLPIEEIFPWCSDIEAFTSNRQLFRYGLGKDRRYNVMHPRYKTSVRFIPIVRPHPPSEVMPPSYEEVCN